MTSVASFRTGEPIREIEGHATIDDDGDMQAIAEFEIVATLGKGSFGTVSLAVDTTDERTYAIKTMFKGTKLSSPTDGGTVGIGTTFLQATSTNTGMPATSDTGGSNAATNDASIIEREIAVMKRLRHQHLVRLHAVIDDAEQQQTHLVMQYIENGPPTTTKHDGTCKTLPYTTAFYYMSQVSSGLDYLHLHGILHRDIKPENILIGKEKTAYVADFGVSSIVSEDRKGGKFANLNAGTMPYMSPELIEQHNALMDFGVESDIWAFGVTLYQMVFGVLPFQGWNGPSLFAAILKNELKFPVGFDDVPDDARQIIESLLHRMKFHHFRHHPFVLKCVREAQKPEAGDAATVTMGQGEALNTDQGQITSLLAFSASSSTSPKEEEELPRVEISFAPFGAEDIRPSLELHEVAGAVTCAPVSFIRREMVLTPLATRRVSNFADRLRSSVRRSLTTDYLSKSGDRTGTMILTTTPEAKGTNNGTDEGGSDKKSAADLRPPLRPRTL